MPCHSIQASPASSLTPSAVNHNMRADAKKQSIQFQIKEITPNFSSLLTSKRTLKRRILAFALLSGFAGASLATIPVWPRIKDHDFNGADQ